MDSEGTIAAADGVLIRSIDSALASAYARAGPWMACRPGCDPCCLGPFEITQLDALRLRRGITELHRCDPRRARRILTRARAAWRQMRDSFPGNPDTGVLSEDEEAQERFFTIFEPVPCPALDPRTRTCDLYIWRPITCRAFGPPVQCGPERFRICDLCFQGAPDEEIRRCSVDLDPEGLEVELLDRLARETGAAGLTIIPWVLAQIRL
jgi:Fe-S-cluster containining protein